MPHQLKSRRLMGPETPVPWRHDAMEDAAGGRFDVLTSALFVACFRLH